MDRDRRYNLRSVVSKCRKTVEEDLINKLLSYGIRNNGEFIPIEKLPHLTDSDKKIKYNLEKAISKERCAVSTDKQAFERYVRHCGFTFINRIAALRAMEVRNLISETIIKRNKFGGMSLRERGIFEENPSLSPDQILEKNLKDAFAEVGEEIKVLFDLDSEYSIIFPSYKSLRDIIELFSVDVTEEDWLQDDVIGWIYQYYNEDARKEYRKSKRNPTADDIPVINQFYTPHWIVRVLVDNSLGRFWLEQQGRCPYFIERSGKQKLIDKRIDIPRDSTEIDQFLENPENIKIDGFCSYLIPLLKEPSLRTKKRARELKILDPACGSGHFLIYAFDVLYRIYLEDEPETPKEDIPGLILENNLFGIDIDLRAVQLAALSIYLKAKSYNPHIKITNMNLICADSHITPGKKRETFLKRFNDIPALKEIFEKIFEDLNNTNELGSLLKVREPFEKLFDEFKEDVQSQFSLKEGIGQSILAGKNVKVPQTRFSVREEDKSLIVPKVRTINEMLQELKEFERESMEKQDMGSLLFATETEKSIGLLSLLSQKYDVILMNPPYGKMPAKTKEYLEKYYPRTKNDLYAAFIELAIDLTKPNGFIGMLTSRTFMFLKTFQKLREDILWNEGVPELLLDTGFGVLDGATVETAAVVLQKSDLEISEDTENRICTFCKLSTFETDIKKKYFIKSLQNYLNEFNSELWFRVKFGDLKQIPGMSYAYWASPKIRSLFTRNPPLDKDVAKKPEMKKIANVKQGLATTDDDRFTRRHWELLKKENLKKWVPFSKGEKLVRFYRDITLVVNWENDGKEIKEHVLRKYPYLNGKWQWVVKNSDFYFKDGLTYCYSTPNGFGIRYLPKNCIFSHAGSLITPLSYNKEDLWKLLGFLASNLTFFQKLMINPTRKFEVGQVAALTVPHKFIKNTTLGNLALEAHDILQEYNTGNEISTIFIKPWILKVLKGFDPKETPITGHTFAYDFKWANWDSLKDIRSISTINISSLKDIAEIVVRKEKLINKRLSEIQELIDEEVYHIYNISKEDQCLIKKELKLKKGLAKSEVGLSSANLAERISEHIKRLISFYAKISIEEDEDGIVPLDQLYESIKEKFEVDFKGKIIENLETELYDILGKSLKDWIAQDYFDYHLTLYKNRPVFWQLSSFRLTKGRSKLPGAFSCFVHYHKLNRDTIPKLIAFYLNPSMEIAKRERDRLLSELNKARIENDRKRVNKKSKEYEQAANRMDELENFEEQLNKIHNPRKDKKILSKNPKWVDEKIKEIRDDGWNPVIDYGVRVNIEPLKEAKILPKSADRVK